jgi:hypothetical protein
MRIKMLHVLKNDLSNSKVRETIKNQLSFYDCIRHIIDSKYPENFIVQCAKGKELLKLENLKNNITTNTNLNKYMVAHVNILIKLNPNDLFRYYSDTPIDTINKELVVVLKDIKHLDPNHHQHQYMKYYREIMNFPGYYPTKSEVFVAANNLHTNILLINIDVGIFETFLVPNYDINKYCFLIYYNLSFHFDIIYRKLDENHHQYVFGYDDLTENIKSLFSLHENNELNLNSIQQADLNE